MAAKEVDYEIGLEIDLCQISFVAAGGVVPESCLAGLFIYKEESMKLAQRFYPDDKRRFEEAGAKDVMFFTADLPDGWMICIIHSRDPVFPNQTKLHLSVSARPVWGMIRGRRVTDEEMEFVKQQFPATVFEEDNAGAKDNAIRHLWEKAA